MGSFLKTGGFFSAAQAPPNRAVTRHVLRARARSADNRLKNGAENNIIDNEESAADPGQKVESIEKAFRYSDAWGDEHSPIDRASFASMPASAQQRGAYGMYSETTRTLTLSRTRCKDPEEAFSAMIHELTHYYDHVSGHVAESVYKQALKELGLRANSKQAYTLMRGTIGMFNDTDIGDAHEILAFGVEKAVSGKGNALAKKILEIVQKGAK